MVKKDIAPAPGEEAQPPAPEPTSQPTRVLLVDDHEVVRQGVRTMLEAEAQIQVVGEAESVKEAIRQAKWLQPSVVVMDVPSPTAAASRLLARSGPASPTPAC